MSRCARRPLLMLRLRLFVALLLCSLAWSAAAEAASRTSAQLALGERVARFARSFVGVRYRWGGTSPRTGFDCSGLVAFVYRRVVGGPAPPPTPPRRRR